MVDTPVQSANNIVSQSKRAVTTALVVSFGGIGGKELAVLVHRDGSTRPSS